MNDLKFAFRQLLKNPGFTAVAVLTLALGLGANTAIFSAVHAVLLKPLPYFEPEQLWSAEVVIPESAAKTGSLAPRIQDFLEWRRAETVCSAIAALRPAEFVLSGDEEPERVGGALVSANFFSFLGVPPVRGREFATAEEQPGNDRVVVISDALWRRRYAADPAIVGRSIALGGVSHTVIGVAPASLFVPTGNQLHPSLAFAPRIDAWKPIAPTPADLEGENWNHGLLIRLRRGQNLEHARRQLQALTNRSIRDAVPDYKGELLVRLLPMREVYAGKIRLRLWLLLGTSTLLLVIAGANVANLFLTRAASRATEFATRLALGARRTDIVHQLLVESIVLSLLGGGVGALVASFGARLLVVSGPDEVRMLADTGLNWPVLLLGTATALITGLACGMGSAWQACRSGLSASLKLGSPQAFGGGRPALTRQVLVGTEITLGTALLATAALLVQSYINILRVDRGYTVERVLAVDLALPGSRYATGPQRAAFYHGLAENIQALPGVSAAGAISDLPAAGNSASRVIFLETDTDFQSTVFKRPTAGIRSATPGYFAASASAVRAGRMFSEQDETPVALISESLASALWPGESMSSVIGRTFREGDVTGPLITIVGVVVDVRPAAADRSLLPQVYRPHHQRPTGRMTVVTRSAQDPVALVAALRRTIRAAEPNLAIPAVRTMTQIVSAAVAQRRFQLQLSSLFAGLALVLGAVGVYGVVSFSVRCRTREIGLRMALGAQRSDVMRSVFSTGLRPVSIGLLFGLGSAVAIATTLRNQLFGIAPTDPVSLGAVVVVMLLASALACLLPARRAAKVDPMEALRCE